MATDAENAAAAAAALAAAVAGPKRVRGDAGEVEQHDLADLIALDRYQMSKAAATKGTRGLRITKLVPPGAD